MDDKAEFYLDSEGRVRWRFIDRESGNVLADSGQGYANSDDAKNGLQRVSHRLPMFGVREADYDFDSQQTIWCVWK